MYTLGIDLHKKKSAWVLIDGNNRESWSSTVSVDPDNFSKTLKKIPVPLDNIRVALEPVGGWRWVYDQLTKSGLDVHVGHPRKMRLIAESTQKNDDKDAYMLARLLASGYFPEARKVSEEIYALRLLLRERQHVVRMRVSTINRLHGVATTQGLHLIPRNNPMSKAGKTFILQRDNSVLKELHWLIEEFDKRIKVFDDLCEKQSRQLPLAQLLMTIPGVGTITALTVIAEVADFSDFKDSKKLVSFAGLAPRQRSSGEHVRFGSITKQGSPMLRTALVECAMRIHPKGALELFEFVKRLTPTTGAKKARIALARKLLTIMWKMVITKTPYDKEKISFSSSNMNMSKPDTGSGA
jgi:transposase